MNTKKFEAILPQTRISTALMRRLVKISKEQELKLADVVRAALDEYTRPHPKAVAVPITGKIKSDDKGEYIIIPTSLLSGDRASTLPPSGNNTPVYPTGQQK